jgi:hypothetical protein
VCTDARPLCGQARGPDTGALRSVVLVVFVVGSVVGLQEMACYRPARLRARDVDNAKYRVQFSEEGQGVTAACFTFFNAHSTLNDVKFSSDCATVGRSSQCAPAHPCRGTPTMAFFGARICAAGGGCVCSIDDRLPLLPSPCKVCVGG